MVCVFSTVSVDDNSRARYNTYPVKSNRRVRVKVSFIRIWFRLLREWKSPFLLMRNEHECFLYFVCSRIRYTESSSDVVFFSLLETSFGTFFFSVNIRNCVIWFRWVLRSILKCVGIEIGNFTFKMAKLVIKTVFSGVEAGVIWATHDNRSCHQYLRLTNDPLYYSFIVSRFKSKHEFIPAKYKSDICKARKAPPFVVINDALTYSKEYEK